MLNKINSATSIDSFLESLTDSAALIALAGSTGKAKAFAALVKQANVAFCKDFHGLKLQIGTLATEQANPFAVLSFAEETNNSIEKRWLLTKAFKHIKSLWPQSDSWHILLDAAATELELEAAHDFVSLCYDQRYRFLKAKNISVTVVGGEPSFLADARTPIRHRYNIEYRKWVNENPDELTSIEIGHRLQKFSEQHGCRFSTMDTKILEEQGLNLLLAVGQASERSPSRLHIVEYTPAKASKEKPIALVGKGVTFDTGGINVKPFESFVNCMKNDMGGAALMSNMFMSLVEAGFPRPLLLFIPCCENLVAERSMKPGSIIKSYSGKDVFIEHTDAEGRLILADAISYCHKHYEPEQTFVAATLTTAAMIQFTNFYTAVHFAPQKFRASLEASASKYGEAFTFWDKFLPFLEANFCNAADLTNMGRMPKDATRSGGSMVAAHFLDQFATRPLVHFDIFASTWNWTGCYPGAHYGATGAPFNSMFDIFWGLGN